MKDKVFCSAPVAQYRLLEQAINEAVMRVLASGDYVLGPEVAAFEAKLADYCQSSHAIGVGSGTDALFLALKALDIGPGDEVITVAHTALATLAAIVQTGATPVIIDVQPNTYTLDPSLLEAAITAQTRAIIPVHLYGLAADMAPILTLAKLHQLPVIEDCAQAIGACYQGKKVGSLGTLGCFSFYPTKNLGAIGDGGAVVTSDPELAQRLTQLRQYGWDNRRKSQTPGVNSRLDEIQAAILNVKLDHLEAYNATRVQLANRYTQAFRGLPQLSTPIAHPQCEHVYHLYVISCAARGHLQSRLAKQGIMAGIHYPEAAHQHPGFQPHIRVSGKLAVTEALLGKILTLPLYPGLELAVQDRIIRVVTESCRRPAIV